MDSQDFWAKINPPLTREQTDDMLDRALEWVRLYSIPERVFSPDQLHLWATKAGYIPRDNDELVACLRHLRGSVLAYSADQRMLDDLIYRYTPR